MTLIQKKGGPYTKSEQRKRREEVYRLHFDYGYSARKIAELMKINRGTINRDIGFLYTNVIKKWKMLDPSVYVMKQVERLEVQRTRQRKLLDNVDSFQEKITIEKFILDIDVKIANFQVRLVETGKDTRRKIINAINLKFGMRKSDRRVISQETFMEVPRKAQERIFEILAEARRNLN